MTIVTAAKRKRGENMAIKIELDTFEQILNYIMLALSVSIIICKAYCKKFNKYVPILYTAYAFTYLGINCFVFNENIWVFIWSIMLVANIIVLVKCNDFE